MLLATVCAAFIATAVGCGQSPQSAEASIPNTPGQSDVEPPSPTDGVSQTAAEDALSPDDEQPQETASTGNGMEAIREAAEADRYLFAFFWKEEDENTSAMRSVFDEAMPDFVDRADAVAVKISEPEQKEIVEQYGLDRAPMPMVLAFAPNGAITGGFPNSFTESDLETAFVSPGTSHCVKALQESKLAMLCVQNGQTQFSEEAMKGVRDFKDSQEYPEFVEIVTLDPKDSAEAKFLEELQISPDTETAVTVLMAPPGVPVGMIEGPTTKELFVEFLSKAQSACADGQCGPGGCGPPQ